ncbi:C39 family peptidase [Paenibacillus sp. CAU 1782]
MKKSRGRQRGRIVQLIIALMLIVLTGIIVMRFSDQGGERQSSASLAVNSSSTASATPAPTPTPKPKQGSIIITVTEEETGLPVVGAEISVKGTGSAEANAETLATGSDGTAKSGLLDYGTSYTVSLTGASSAYSIDQYETTVSIGAPTQTTAISLGLMEHVKEVARAEDGTVSVSKSYMEIPVIMQKPELPNGCEITSLTAVLNFYGYTADKLDMADNYLPKEGWVRKDGKLYGPDPNKAYAGDPRMQPGGFFSFAPPIVDAAEAYIADNGGSHTVTDITGSTREEIVEKLMQGIPVVAWTTLDLSAPKIGYFWYFNDTGELYNAPINLHVVVLNGYDVDTNTLHVMNPLEGQVSYSADTFFKSYELMGSHALIVEP